MRLFYALSKPWIFALGVLLVALLGIADTLTGQEISFSVFYMLPIYLATWYGGRWPGVAISLLSALTWLAADYAAGHIVRHSLIPAWNMIVRLAFFLLMTYLLSELQKNEERRRALERIFFHDLLNLLGSVRGFAELLKEEKVTPTQEVYELIYHAADQSLEEIEAQRMLANAESKEMVVESNRINSRLLLNLVADLYRHHQVGRAKIIKVADDAQTVQFESDQSILFRILGNMLKNALESTASGGQVEIGCRQQDQRICFWVKNPAVIPDAIKRQIFRTRVSSKAKERGVGTYSIKVLTEYIGGDVAFSSDAENGTVFRVCCPLKLQGD